MASSCLSHLLHLGLLVLGTVAVVSTDTNVTERDAAGLNKSSKASAVNHNVDLTTVRTTRISTVDRLQKDDVQTSLRFTTDGANTPPAIVNQSLSNSSPNYNVPDARHDNLTTVSQADGNNAEFTTTTLQTSIEPVTRRTTCFPGFQCIHGYCLTAFSCECEADWTGLFCHVPCPDNCGQDGECGMNPSGNAVCICRDRSIPYTHEKGCSSDAQTTRAPLPTTENLSRPVAERECFPGFLCVHGYCQFGFTRCVCDDGWVGQFCHEACPLSCQNGGVCGQDESRNLYCDCVKEFTGANCELSKSGFPNESTKTSQSAPLILTTADPFTEFEMENATRRHGEELSSNGTEVTTETTTKTANQECAPGFTCMHGSCVPGEIKCECEPEWEGFFCQKSRLQRTTTASLPQFNVSEVTSNTSIPGHLKFTDWKPLEGYGNLSDISLRNCSLGFVCHYGNCSNGIGIGCDCEPGFAGHFCHEPCPLYCGERGKCKKESKNKTVTYSCDCQFPMYGSNCSLVRQFKEREQSTSHWYAVGVACALVLILMLLLVVLPYILWQRRNLTIMKIVFWLRSYEEDDGREYDGFVAYASSDKDRQFVLSELIPNLEGRLSFSLCIHERDFMPGVYIATNINEAIRKSRRTLIVVSAAFIRRQWCQFEFEVAVREMVEQKHRILPVILGDISKIKEEMSDSLKHILSTVTYLEYPGAEASEQDKDRFWKKIELSMPKKKVKTTSVSSTTQRRGSISYPRISSKPKSDDATEQIAVSIPPSPCQSPSLSPAEEQTASKSKRHMNIIRIPASIVDNKEDQSENSTFILSHWWRKLKGQGPCVKKISTSGNRCNVSSSLEKMPEKFVNSMQRNVADSSTKKMNSENSDNLILSVISPTTVALHLQDTSNALELSKKLSKYKEKSGFHKKRYNFQNNVLSPVEKAPVYQISENYLGNQSILSSS